MIPALRVMPKSSMSKRLPLESGKDIWGHCCWAISLGILLGSASEVTHMINSMNLPLILKHEDLIFQIPR